MNFHWWYVPIGIIVYGIIPIVGISILEILGMQEVNFESPEPIDVVAIIFWPMSLVVILVLAIWLCFVTLKKWIVPIGRAKVKENKIKFLAWHIRKKENKRQHRNAKGLPEWF